MLNNFDLNTYTMCFSNDGTLKIGLLNENNQKIWTTLSDLSNNDELIILKVLYNKTIIEEKTTLSQILKSLKPFVKPLSLLLDYDIDSYINVLDKPHKIENKKDFEKSCLVLTKNFECCKEMEIKNLDDDFFNMFEKNPNGEGYILKPYETTHTGKFIMSKIYDMLILDHNDNHFYSIMGLFYQIKDLPVKLYDYNFLWYEKNIKVKLKSENNNTIIYKKLRLSENYTLFDILKAVFSGLFYYSFEGIFHFNNEMQEVLKSNKQDESKNNENTENNNKNEKMKVIIEDNAISDIIKIQKYEESTKSKLLDLAKEKKCLNKIGEVVEARQKDYIEKD